MGPLNDEAFQSDQVLIRAVRHELLSSVDWIAGLLFFAASAAVVVWQNARLAVLWDLSYILENAHRIALGQIPYRDFPFPYAPLTFLTQAGLIRLTGHVFWHTTVYCAVLNGMSTVLAWRIMVKALRDAGLTARWLGIALTLPLIPLGVYSVFPHPFYDPDCTVAILLAIYLLQRAAAPAVRNRRRSISTLSPLVAGAFVVLPLFVKQNTGLAFVAAALVCLLLVNVLERERRRFLRQCALTLLGAAVAFVFALWLINWTAGLTNYWHWTIQFAAARRTPARSEMLGIYNDIWLLLWLALIASGGVIFWLLRQRRNRLLSLSSALLIAAPFLWPTIYLLRDNDPSERAERLVNTWPVLIIASLILAIVTIKRRRGIDIVLPFILFATIHGAFMSQQLWGSTYAIWPLFMILLATTLADLTRIVSKTDLLMSSNGGRVLPKLNDDSFWFQLPLVILIVVSLSISGTYYLRSHERLDYANLDDGELKRSSLPQLKGMATRGDWIPTFEELIRYTNTNIPRDEGVMVLPGEDLFYFTTGRTPKFPVLMFDHTVNPYSPLEIRDLARARDIRWLIVKQDIQDEDEEIEKLRDELTDVLEEEFEQVESLENYEIYHRRDPNKKEEDDDDDRN